MVQKNHDTHQAKQAFLTAALIKASFILTTVAIHGQMFFSTIRSYETYGLLWTRPIALTLVTGTEYGQNYSHGNLLP